LRIGVILISLSLAGCWFYSFRGTLPPHIKNIAIPLFNDRTAEFNLQQVVTDQIRLGFIRENIIKFAEEENAHSVLYGNILDIQDRPLVYDDTESGEAVREYRLTLRIEAEWFDRVENKSLFKKQFTGYSEYDPSGQSGVTRDSALQNALNMITEDIINAILAGW